jgi:hypothetical protein
MSDPPKDAQPKAQAGRNREAEGVAGEVGVLHSNVDLWESRFSNQVLRLMQKGTTGLKNIQLLRWCQELGMEPLWNIIYGFPGESPSEYVRMARLLPLLTHLGPPQSCGPIRLDRFSPYFNHPDVGSGVPEAQVRGVLHTLQKAKLMVEDEGHYLRAC